MSDQSPIAVNFGDDNPRRLTLELDRGHDKSTVVLRAGVGRHGVAVEVPLAEFAEWLEMAEGFLAELRAKGGEA